MADHASTPRPAVVCLTESGYYEACEAAEILDGEVHAFRKRVAGAADVVFDDVAEHLRALFAAGRPIVGVCAAGILIRSLAALLSDKTTEPPVVALAEDGSSVAPLLGGHHGANAIALRLADAAGAHAAITTAGDLALRVALDEPGDGWRGMAVAPDGAEVDFWETVRDATAAVLSGAAARIEGDVPPFLEDLVAVMGDRLTVRPGVTAAASPRVRLTIDGVAASLVYAETTITVGVGCERGADPDALATAVFDALKRLDVPRHAVAGIFSLDLKADEAAVAALPARFEGPWGAQVQARFFDAETLETLTPRLATPSEVVFAEVGCHGVAEAAALAGAGDEAILIAAKTKVGRCTVALAAAPSAIHTPPGRLRGTVRIVGIGPSGQDAITEDAANALSLSDVWMGYRLYLELVESWRLDDVETVVFELGEEEARCRAALERAAEGRDVALICSGDGGIYAMGALVFELLDRGDGPGGVSAAARRVEVVSIPGVTAMQAASAAAGALLGHDFCAISLSDLLTPWETIETRIRAAAEGDFVVAFYNPVSKRRRTQLAAARDVLLRARGPDTPVLLGTELGRAGQALRARTLGTLDVDEVDMLTVVLVGSSASRAFRRGDVSAGAEGVVMYTPRGYAAKTAV